MTHRPSTSPQNIPKRLAIAALLAMACSNPTQSAESGLSAGNAASTSGSTGESGSTGVETTGSTGTDGAVVETDSTTTSGISSTGSETSGIGADTEEATTDPTGTESVCGNGVVETGEVCDDSINDGSYNGCAEDCQAPGPHCGDEKVNGEETCDDGNESDADDCTNACEPAKCGDGLVQEGIEECDDANKSNNDECTNECKKAVCGDGIQSEAELCDDGMENGQYGKCAEDCQSYEAYCGDGKVQPNEGEQCDQNVGLKPGLKCNDACQYKVIAFQLYCEGTCSWGGPSGCDQADANTLCQLRTGNPGVIAANFTVGYTEDKETIGCSKPNMNLGETNVGPVAGYNYVPVVFKNAPQTHPGKSIINIDCGEG